MKPQSATQSEKDYCNTSPREFFVVFFGAVRVDLQWLENAASQNICKYSSIRAEKSTQPLAQISNLVSVVYVKIASLAYDRNINRSCIHTVPYIIYMF